MSDETKSWEQKENEPDLWYGRFNCFRLLGTKRSVNAVFSKEYKKNIEKHRTNANFEWYDAAKTWEWEERARSYDEQVRAEEDRIIAAERDKVIRSGFALQHKRIQALDRITDNLIAMTKVEEKVWIPDVKAIGTGPEAERVDLVNFNAPLFTLIEKYMASIAAELGERVKKKDIAITELPPNVYIGFNPDKDGSES